MISSNDQFPPTQKPTEPVSGVTVRLAGDSGDGMQLLGTQLTNTSALSGNDVATYPDFPAEIRAPVLCISGQADSIAPPPMSEPVVRDLAHARLLRPGTGHVGMVVGSSARASVWRPLSGFLAGQRG